MSSLRSMVVGLIAAVGVVCATGVASAALTVHAGKTVGGKTFDMSPPGTAILSNCKGICESMSGCFGFAYSSSAKTCKFVKRPVELIAGGLKSASGVDFYEKVVTRPGTREVECTIPGAEALSVARTAGYGFECFLYDHTVNPANIISFSQRYDLTGPNGPKAEGNTLACSGVAPAGFQTLYMNLFRNRKLQNGWVFEDYHVTGDAWGVGPQDNALIRLKSNRQYKQGERFTLRLADIVLKTTKTGWFFCEDAAAEAFQ